MKAVSDFYTLLWDLLFKISVPLRAVLITIVVLLVIKLILIKIFPHIIRALLFALCKIVSFIAIIALLFIYYIFIKLSRICFNGKVLYPIKIIDDGFHFVLEKSEHIASNNKQVAAFFNKNKKSINIAMYLILLFFCIWLLLPSAKIFDNTRISGYSNFALDKYFAFEEMVTERIGIYPTKEAIKTASSVQPEPEPLEEKYFKLNKSGLAGANIRKNPDMDAGIVTSVSGDAALLYLDESFTDDEGRAWYKIKTVKDEIGWISSRIVEEMK